MARQMTEERKKREIAKWTKVQNKPKRKGYLFFFTVLITLIYIADEVTTQIGGQMQSVIASQIFAPVVGEEFAIARMSALGTVSIVVSALSFLYKPLSDRFGRKIFLIINTMGMALGLFVISIAHSITMYIIGSAVIAFFIPHDMQAVYIQESVPAKHRAKMYSVIKAIATLGIFIIPLLRMIYIPGSDYSDWRMVYLVPAVLIAAIVFIGILFVRESDAFIENRLSILRMTEEEKAEAQRKNQDVESQGGLFKALKFAFKHKQMRWLLIGTGFIMFGMVITMYYETVLTYGYAQQFVADGMAIEAAKKEANTFVTQALLLFSIGSAIMQFFPGFIADKCGRKTATCAMVFTLIVCYILFYIGATKAWNPYLVGFFCGTAIGSYISAIDILGLMCSESAPTNLRSSIMAVQPIVSGAIYVFAMVLAIVLINILGDAAIGMTCLCISIPGLVAGLVILFTKVKETKGVDMGAIHGNEFE